MKKIILLAFFCWMSQAWSADATALFQKKLEAIRTMQATFSQVIYAQAHELSRASGQMALARPGRVRWQTIQPMAQLVIADGRRLWIYDTDLEQVTVKKQAQGVDTSAGLFLSDDATNLSQSFDISVKQQGDRSDFELRAKSSPAECKHVIIQLKGNVLCGMELFDPLGQRTTVYFQKIKTNQPVSPRVFQFTPPKGVDVIDEGDARD